MGDVSVRYPWKMGYNGTAYVDGSMMGFDVLPHE